VAFADAFNGCCQPRETRTNHENIYAAGRESSHGLRFDAVNNHGLGCSLECFTVRVVAALDTARETENFSDKYDGQWRPLHSRL
jgi:hypothetical protein